jgi:dihydrofolate reductase
MQAPGGPREDNIVGNVMTEQMGHPFDLLLGRKTYDLDLKITIPINGDVVRKIKQLKNDLVDEFWLKTFPIALGAGKRLFAEGTMPAGFTLAGSRISPSGVVASSYARAGEVKLGSFESP